MDPEEIHVFSDDGTRIVGTRLGDGPPVVLLPAGPGTSSVSWRHLVPQLGGFACHLVDTRGRGASDLSTDLAPNRLVEDVAAYVGALDQPVALFAWGSQLWALVAAALQSEVAAVVAHEPTAAEALGDLEPDIERLLQAVGAAAASDGPDAAAGAFLDGAATVYDDVDLASGLPQQFWTESTPGIAGFLQEEAHLAAQDTSPTGPETLAAVQQPVLLSRGDRSLPWFGRSVDHIAAQLPRATVRELSDAGHFAPWSDASSLAAIAVPFLDSALGRTEAMP